MTEQQTSRLLRESTSGLTADVDDLVRGAVARGRTRRRRRRVGTTFAAAAVVGVIGIAASIGPGLLDQHASERTGVADTGTPSPGPTSGPTTGLTTGPIDRLITVAAADIPGIVAGLLPEGRLGETRTDPPYSLVDQRQQKVVHFMWEGTLTTFTIERADGLAGCEAQAGPGGGPRHCVVDGGIQFLTWGPTTADGVTAQGVSAFVHGYIVTAISYNAADGKDVETVTAQPPISMELLTMLATQDVWFEEPPAPS